MTAKEKALRERVVRAAMRWHKRYVRLGNDDLATRECAWFMERKCAALAAHQKGRKHGS